jgi:hypothetical protein
MTRFSTASPFRKSSQNGPDGRGPEFVPKEYVHDRPGDATEGHSDDGYSSVLEGSCPIPDLRKAGVLAGQAVVVFGCFGVVALVANLSLSAPSPKAARAAGGPGLIRGFAFEKLQISP